MERRGCLTVSSAGQHLAPFPCRNGLSVCPPAYPVEGGECEIRGLAALSPHDFRPETYVVLHPGGQTEVKGIALQFAFMVGEGAQKISDFFGRILDHQVGAGHLSPVFGLDQKRIQLRSLTQSVHGEKMHADMGTVPIRDMGKEDGPRAHWSMISTSLPTDFFQ